MVGKGRGNGEWVSDNSSTAGAFFMVFNPGGRAQLRTSPGKTEAQHQQLGYMDGGGSVQRSATPMSNNVNQLVNAVVLNYMALHGEEGLFDIPNHGLGDGPMRDSLTAFQPIVTGTIPPLQPT